jgi:hypothetical protein
MKEIFVNLTCINQTPVCGEHKSWHSEEESRYLLPYKNLKKIYHIQGILS